MNPFLPLILAVAISMLVIPLTWRFATRLGLVDLPDSRKVHTQPVPRVGGWGITIGSLLPLCLSFQLDPLLQSFVIGTIILFVFGVWDDSREIGHWPKFCGQILAVAAVVYYGDLYVARVPFLEDVTLGAAIGKPFTLFVMIGMINAMNHSDGLDGLAGGESLLSLIAIAFLGFLADNLLVVAIALATIGGILGFLRYNTHPARVFMGDSGSQVLGFTLGFLAVYLTQVAHPAVSPALPLLLLGLPVADILMVLYRRIRGRLNWFRATRNHVHHRLLDLGFNHYETVVTIYSVHAVLVTGAVLMRYQSDAAVAAAYLLVIVALFAALAFAERRGWRVPRPAAVEARLTAAIRRLKNNEALRQMPLVVIAAVIAAVMLLGSFWIETVPRDFAVVSGMLAVILAVQMLRNRAAGSMLVRSAIYVTAVFSAYLIATYPGPARLPVETLTTAILAALAVAIAVFVRFVSDKRFEATPTDYLIAFGVLTLLAFGNADIHARATAKVVMSAIVLLYGCEVLIGRITGRWHILPCATLVTLVTLASRGLA